MGLINRELCDRETVFLLAEKEHVHVSSTRIRELAMFNRKLEGFVPSEIEDEVYQKMAEHYRSLPTFKQASWKLRSATSGVRKNGHSDIIEWIGS